MILLVSWFAVMAIARTVERSWWSPSAVLALVLGVSAVGTSVFAPEYYESLGANLYMELMVLLAVVGSVVGRSIGSQYATSSVTLQVRRLRLFVAFGFGSSLYSLVVTFQVLHASLADFFTPAALIRAAQASTMQRYTEGLNYPVTYNIANALLLVYACLAVIHFVSTRRINFVMLTPLLIYVLANVLVTTRAPIIYLLIMVTFSAIYADRLLSPRSEFRPLFSRRLLSILVVGGIVLAGIFFFFQVLRFGQDSSRSANDVWAHLRRWPWGNLPGFSLWFDGLAPAESTHLPGFYTFMGIYDNLGLEDRVTGGYAGYVYLTPTEPANIYTMFRGLAHDFGFIGSCLFMIIVGSLGGVASSGKVLRWQGAMALYVAVSGLMAFSFVVSFWAFTANLVAAALLPAAIRLFNSQSEEVPEIAFAQSGHNLGRI